MVASQTTVHFKEPGNFHNNQLTMYFYRVTYAFRVNLHSVTAWMSRNSLLKTGAISAG